jgi:hypothetical protein
LLLFEPEAGLFEPEIGLLLFEPEMFWFVCWLLCLNRKQVCLNRRCSEPEAGLLLSEPEIGLSEPDADLMPMSLSVSRIY